jgi:hypothetical protein
MSMTPRAQQGSLRMKAPVPSGGDIMDVLQHFSLFDAGLLLLLAAALLNGFLNEF